MSYFKAKMQNRFRLGLRPRPCWGSSQRSPRRAHSASPDPLTGFEGVLLLTEGKGMGGKGREGEGEGEEKEERGKEGKGEGEGKEGKGEGCVMAWGDGRPWASDTHSPNFSTSVNQKSFTSPLFEYICMTFMSEKHATLVISKRTCIIKSQIWL